ncbi:VWA domain-containing protein [Actinomadura macra]|uniref:VWA domain-containing protein n=1 Tax=Actinomadura macra TaxID=46164 RepID=UPI001FE05AD9|nr:VWA domain-containing protein [Actinomadura macra]
MPAPSGAWLALSAAFTDAVTDLTDREDLAVRCAPGLGRGAPGCFLPALATIELDGAHLGQQPGTCDPTRPADRNRYPALWGVLTHEAAHATHTCWTPPAGVSAAAVDAALALEESRIEAAQIRRRPADRRWLRASTIRLVLADYTTPTTPGPSSSHPSGSAVTTPHMAMTPWNAGRAAALLLARTDAGILKDKETASLTAEITTIVGPSRLSALSALWHIAHVTDDDDTETMLDLGRRWCRILGTAPDKPAPPPAPGTPGASGDPSPLAKAIRATLSAVYAATPRPAPTGASGRTGMANPDPAEERRREKQARQEADRAARRVFAPSTQATQPRGRTAITGTRPPRPEEQAAARRLARKLRAASHRDRVTTTRTSPTPPGRLTMRGALAADAQRAAGVTPTAEPFTQAVRRHVPAPPLRLGIACDVSGSMNALAGPVASAAWIMARAAGHLPDALAATVIFGTRVRAVTHPGKTPTDVTEFAAEDSREDFVQGVDALDSTLGLTRTGAGRLLVIVSDGIFRDDQLKEGQKRIDRLTIAGCAVLWLALSGDVTAMNGTHLVTLTDPAAAADAIATAAIHAIRSA